MVSSPNPGTNGNQLNGVAFARNDLNATDVWAVGSANGGTASGILIVRYQNGAWSRYSTDNLGIDGNLNGISGSKSDDYWAVGSYAYNSHDYSLALHWDGTGWTRVGTVNVPYTHTYLTSVSAVDSQTAWAAGYYIDDSGYNHPFMIRWDGTQWNDDTNNLPTNAAGIVLTGVSFNSESTGWAVGTDANNQSIAFYHDSNGWREIDPYPGHHDGKLGGVDFIANNSAWAAGSVPNSDPTTDYWNGTQWTHYSPESPGSNGGIFHSVSGVSNTDVWAVGTFFNGHQHVTLIEHYN